MDTKITSFNKAQLLTLNELVQALPMAQRKSYLEDLGELWEYLSNSEDYLVDERDYNIYSIVCIGDQAWLGENLRYKGVRYSENPANPNLFYGCLYDWAAVMDIDEQYNKEEWGGLDVCHQGIAPMGWHIPSDGEWKELERYMGVSEIDVEKDGWRGDIGDRLKSSYGWYEDGNGDDSRGLTSLPAGYYSSGSFDYLGKLAFFWSSTEKSSDRASYRGLYYADDGVGRHDSNNSLGYSCRCLKNKVGFR